MVRERIITLLVGEGGGRKTRREDRNANASARISSRETTTLSLKEKKRKGWMSGAETTTPLATGYSRKRPLDSSGGRSSFAKRKNLSAGAKKKENWVVTKNEKGREVTPRSRERRKKPAPPLRTRSNRPIQG